MNYPRQPIKKWIYSNISGCSNYTIPVQTSAILVIIYTSYKVHKISTVVLTSLINLKATTISPKGITRLCRLVIQKVQEKETYKMSEHTISAIDVAWAVFHFIFQSFFSPWFLQLLCTSANAFGKFGRKIYNSSIYKT